MSLSDRSLRTRNSAAALLVLVFLDACNAPNGAGRVHAHFFKNECGPGDLQDLSNYGFDAEYMATQRFSAMLVIQVLKYKAALEESDGLSVRIDINRLIKQGLLLADPTVAQIVRADPTRAAVIRTSTQSSDANVALSLFTTCPNFPTSYASAGQLSLDKVTLASDPTNTGEGERLGGTVTATLSRVNEDGPVAVLQAEFDFSPPRRPLVNNM